MYDKQNLENSERGSRVGERQRAYKAAAAFGGNGEAKGDEAEHDHQKVDQAGALAVSHPSLSIP